MLLSFSVKNYKSFTQEACLSMYPSTLQTNLDYSILHEGEKEALCCSAIYGPNGAGKTNLLRALRCLQSIILAGNVKEIAAQNCTEFFIRFTNQGTTIEYSLSALLGTVEKEKLSVDDKEIFYREGNGSELFVNSTKQFEIIKEWFAHKLLIAFPETVTAFKIDESAGMKRFSKQFPLLVDTITKGGVLFIDELDTSFSPTIVMSIINLIHNDDVNKKNAQLIFTTHNPLYMDDSLLRRDEIKFVDKGNIYSLADFQISESGSYTDRYLQGAYGAIEDVDFSPIIEEIKRLMK